MKAFVFFFLALGMSIFGADDTARLARVYCQGKRDVVCNINTICKEMAISPYDAIAEIMPKKRSLGGNLPPAMVPKQDKEEKRQDDEKKQSAYVAITQNGIDALYEIFLEKQAKNKDAVNDAEGTFFDFPNLELPGSLGLLGYTAYSLIPKTVTPTHMLMGTLLMQENIKFLAATAITVLATYMIVANSFKKAIDGGVGDLEVCKQKMIRIDEGMFAAQIVQHITGKYSKYVAERDRLGWDKIQRETLERDGKNTEALNSKLSIGQKLQAEEDRLHQEWIAVVKTRDTELQRLLRVPLKKRNVVREKFGLVVREGSKPAVFSEIEVNRILKTPNAAEMLRAILDNSVRVPGSIGAVQGSGEEEDKKRAGNLPIIFLSSSQSALSSSSVSTLSSSLLPASVQNMFWPHGPPRSVSLQGQRARNSESTKFYFSELEKSEVLEIRKKLEEYGIFDAGRGERLSGDEENSIRNTPKLATWFGLAYKHCASVS